MRSAIKVLIVDDSALIRQLLSRALSVDPGIEIVGSARTGIEAIEKTHELQPDVITLDIEMPEMTGLEALPHIIKTSQSRVIMLSALDDPELTYQALALGATDFIVKPSSGFATSLTDLTEILLKKIKTAYRVNPARRLAISAAKLRSGDSTVSTPKGGPPDRLVAIAASTGGPPALEAVLSGLSADMDAAYVIVQHLPKGFTGSLARRLTRVTDIPVVEAADGMPLDRNTAYIAPHGTHMIVRGRRTIRIGLEDTPSLHGVRPAADPLFESVADNMGSASVGVLLTGMGSDGAQGLFSIQKAGGVTIAQDEETSVVWGMPGAAVRLGAATHVVPIELVSTAIKRALRG